MYSDTNIGYKIMLRKMTKRTSGELLDYCPSVDRYRNTESGKFVSQKNAGKIFSDFALSRALKIGGLIVRVNE